MVDTNCKCWDIMLNEMNWPAPVTAVIQEYTHEIQTPRGLTEVDVIRRWMRVFIRTYGINTYYGYTDPISRKRCADMPLRTSGLDYPRILLHLQNSYTMDRDPAHVHMVVRYEPIKGMLIRYDILTNIDSFTRLCDALSADGIHKLWEPFASAGIAMPDIWKTTCQKIHTLIRDITERANHEPINLGDE